MELRLFNTLTRKVEPFRPLDPEGRRVDLYCCGPTVHDFAHIGNFRTFVFADLTRRFLEFCGYQVRHVMNITDVEDKIIRRVSQNGSSLKEFTARYENAFLEDLNALSCTLPHHTPRATEHIPEIIDLILKLQERGIAYTTQDGSVYFSIEKYRSSGHCYGQLLNLNLEEMRPSDRVASDEYGKESIADFALWKARVNEDGEVFWPSPWGEGRPGWHIECSAMSMKLLGPSFDLHLGGEDLVFPHHEDEIAQSEGAALQCPGHRFVKHWLHGAHLLVEGKKMSKSLGNYFTLRDLLGKGFTGREIRFLLLSAHYRESFNFTLEGLAGARTALGRIDDCLRRLGELAGSLHISSINQPLATQFREALAEDLNVSKAWACIFDWVRDQNKLMSANHLTAEQAAEALSDWAKVDLVLGLKSNVSSTTVSEDLELLLAERQAARKAKDFKRSDAIRDELKSRGYAIEDTPTGPRLKRISN